MSDLTFILLRKALSTALRWPHPIRLSFNLSTLDLASTETVSDILKLVADSGFDPSRLDFEITETAIVREFQAIQSAASRLRALGCGVSLDDFGSSPGRLMHWSMPGCCRVVRARQFASDFAAPEVAAVLDDLARLHVRALNRIHLNDRLSLSERSRSESAAFPRP